MCGVVEKLQHDKKNRILQNSFNLYRTSKERLLIYGDVTHFGLRFERERRYVPTCVLRIWTRTNVSAAITAVVSDSLLEKSREDTDVI